MSILTLDGAPSPTLRSPVEGAGRPARGGDRKGARWTGKPG
jgi:hypothetical protein